MNIGDFEVATARVPSAPFIVKPLEPPPPAQDPLRKAQRREWVGMLAGIGVLVFYFGVAREEPADAARRGEREAAFGEVTRLAHHDRCERRLELDGDRTQASGLGHHADSSNANVDPGGRHRLVSGGDVLRR